MAGLAEMAGPADAAAAADCNPMRPADGPPGLRFPAPACLGDLPGVPPIPAFLPFTLRGLGVVPGARGAGSPAAMCSRPILVGSTSPTLGCVLRLRTGRRPRSDLPCPPDLVKNFLARPHLGTAIATDPLNTAG